MPTAISDKTQRFSIVQMRTGARSEQPFESIRQGDPAVARAIYETYAGPIGIYLRSHSGCPDVHDATLSVLLEAMRAVRNLEIGSIEELTATILELSSQAALQLRRQRDPSPAMTLDRRNEVVSRMFGALDISEREILLRSCLLAEKEDEISRNLALPVVHVRRTHAKAKVLFRLCSDSGAQLQACASA